MLLECEIVDMDQETTHLMKRRLGAPVGQPSSRCMKYDGIYDVDLCASYTCGMCACVYMCVHCACVCVRTRVLKREMNQVCRLYIPLPIFIKEEESL